VRSGKLTLAGTNSTYTAGAFIAAGTLEIGNGGSTGAIAGNITNTGTLAFNRTGTLTNASVISGSGALTKSGAGTVILTAANTYSGGTTINTGTLQVGLGGNNTTGSLGGGNIVNNGNLFLSVSNTLTITNEISGTGTLNSGSLTTVLSGSNSYSGLTTVSAGILRVDSGNALGSTNAGTVVANGARLQLQGVTVGNEALTISGNGLGNSGGALRAGTGANTYGGKVTLAADSRFFAGSGTSLTLSASGDALDLASYTLTVEGSGANNVNGAIVGTGGITKIGTGTMTLAASNSYSGATAVTLGVLNLNSASGSALGSTSSVSVATNATLLVSQGNQVNDSAAVTLSGGTIQRASGVSEVFGSLSVSGSGFLDYGIGATGTLSFGTYTPSALLSVQNFGQGNVLTFTSDLSSYLPSLQGGGFSSSQFSFDNGFTSNWNGSAFTITAIPEPATVLAALGLVGLLLYPQSKRILGRLRR